MPTDEPSAGDEAPRRVDVETRKMQGALISQEIGKAIDTMGQMSGKDMRDVIRRYLPIGPPKEITQLEDQADENILLAVLDKIEERPWLCFMYRQKGKENPEHPEQMKVRIEAKDSRYFVGLLCRILSSNYKRYLAERDTIGLGAYSLEGRKRPEVGHVTSLRDILRRGPAK